MDTLSLWKRIYNSILRMAFLWVILGELCLFLDRYAGIPAAGGYLLGERGQSLIFLVAAAMEGLLYLDLILPRAYVPWAILPVLSLAGSRVLFLASTAIEWEEDPGAIWLIPLIAFSLILGLHLVMKNTMAEILLAAAGLAGMLCAWGMSLPLSESLIACVFLTTLCLSLEVFGIRKEGWVLYLAAICLVAFLIPAGEKPYDWGWVRETGAAAGRAFRSIRVDLAYYAENLGIGTASQRGYSSLFSNGALPGENSLEVVYLEHADGRNDIYLTGSVFDRFDGRSFHTGAESDRSEEKALPYNAWIVDYLIGLRAHDISREEAACFSEIESTVIRYGYLRTKDVLHPEHVLLLEQDQLREMTGDAGDYSFRRSKSRDYSYRVTYLELDYANPYLEAVMQDPQQSLDSAEDDGKEPGREKDLQQGQDRLPEGADPDYEELDQYFRELYGAHLSGFLTKEAYDQIRRAGAPDQSRWLDVTGTTGRMEELAARVTEGCDTDLEKARAIEAFLHQYSYDGSVDDSGKENFVDSFLFESQKGYCVHFASAMTLLLRLNHIPARYCSGLHAHNAGSSGEICSVTGSQAHAWPEAYIKGFGWMRFEPTTGEETYRDLGWNLMVTGEEGEQGSAFEITGAYPPSAYVPEPEDSAAEDASQEQRTRRNLTASLILAARFFGLMLLYVLLVLLAVRGILRIRLGRMEMGKKLGLQAQEIRKWILKIVTVREKAADQSRGERIREGLFHEGEESYRPLTYYADLLRQHGPSILAASVSAEAAARDMASGDITSGDIASGDIASRDVTPRDMAPEDVSPGEAELAGLSQQAFEAYYRVRFGHDLSCAEEDYRQGIRTLRSLQAFYGNMPGKGKLGRRLRVLLQKVMD